MSGKKSNKEISIKSFQMLHHVVYVNLTFPEYSKWKEFLMAPPPKNSVITRIEKILKTLTLNPNHDQINQINLLIIKYRNSIQS